MKKIGTAWPTVIEIHDDYYERKHGGVRLVGRIFTDGTRGQVEVLVAEYRQLLTDLFTRERAPTTGGGTLRDGSHYLLAAQRYLPWKKDSIANLIETELPRRSLRADVVRG